jgi:hypothetical protein
MHPSALGSTYALLAIRYSPVYQCWPAKYAIHPNPCGQIELRTSRGRCPRGSRFKLEPRTGLSEVGYQTFQYG